MQNFGHQAEQDRRAIEAFIDRKQLSTYEQAQLQRIKATWSQAMAQPLIWGKDLGRELIDYLEEHQGEFFARGGLSSSDTVPAMLTPGEYVVNREAVKRYGAGFFSALNDLALPAKALAQRVQGFAAGGLVNPMAWATPVSRPVLSAENPVSKTIRVELAAGDRKVTATIDARDEARLLQILETARARAV